MSQKVSLPVIIDGIKTRKDRSLNISVESAYELSPANAATLFSLRQTQAWMVLSTEDDITEKDIPEVRPDAELGTKTPSLRLRNTLYVFWEQKGKPGTWQQFYLTQMERLIERVKDQLEPES